MFQLLICTLGILLVLLPAAVSGATSSLCTKVFSDTTFTHFPPNNGSSATSRADAVNVVATINMVYAASPTGQLRIYSRTVNGTKPGTKPTWSLLQTIVIPDAIPASYSTFGASMAVSGNWLIVGQPGYQDPNNQYNNIGAVWTFYLSNISGLYDFTGRLTDKNDTRSVIGAGFGSTVAVYGNMVLVSAPDCCDTSPRGAVYAFYYATWPPQTFSVQSAQITNSWQLFTRDGIVVPFEISSNQGFGNAMTITGDYVWIGAWDAQGTTDTPGVPGPVGQGTVFSLPLVNAATANISSTLSQLDYSTTELPPGPGTNAYCGYSSTPCDFDFNQWAFSCPGFGSGNNPSGAVYIVTLLGTWRTAVLLQGGGNFFGQAIALEENILVVADNGSNVFVYERVYTLQGSTLQLANHFTGTGWYGRGVSVNNITLAIGGQALVEIYACGTSGAVILRSISLGLLFVCTALVAWLVSEQ